MMNKINILLLTLLLAAAVVSAQDEFKLNVNVDLTELHVNVTDERDRPVGNLTKENFQVFEDQTQQQISVFKHEDLPVSLGLVVDNSRSIEPRKQRLDAAALSFVRQGNSEDETFLIHFDDKAKLSLDFTDNIPELEKALAAMRPFGQTAIYDALMLAVKEMDDAKHQKKAILLITDGVDNASTYKLEDVVEAVRRSQVAIYTVGLLSVAGGLKAEEDLVRIASLSGGRAYFPENVADASTAMQRVARDLREQYTIGYFSSNGDRSGKWRSVRLKVLPPAAFPKTAQLNANYRHGYYGPDSGR